MNKKHFICHALLLSAGTIFATNILAAPPEPDPGKRWVINPLFSDEFDQESLDSAKWYDYHPLWQGRPPAKFDPSTIALAEGKLQIRNKMLDQPDGDYTIGGGAVRSKSDQASFGYYEAKFKASRLSMSTTFWLSNPRTKLLGPNNLGADCENDTWSMELDVAEQIGAPVDAAFASSFLTSQQYNTHVFYNDCDGNVNDFKAGVNAAEGNGSVAADNTLPNGTESWEQFNTYAAWWKDENEVDFFLNNNFAGRVQVATDVLDNPFNRTLSMNMVTETYNWATPYPTAAELSDDSRNTSYYEWVRSYVSIAVGSEKPNFGGPNESLIVKNGGFESGDLTSWVGWGPNTREVVDSTVNTGEYAAHLVGPGAHEQVLALEKNTDYRLTGYLNVLSGKVRLGAKVDIGGGANFGNTETSFTNGEFKKVEFEFKTGDQTRVKIFAWGLNPSEYYLDDVSVIAINDDDSDDTVATIADIFDDVVTMKSNNYSGGTLNYAFLYSSDEDRDAVVVILDGETELASETHSLKAGYGHLVASLAIEDLLSSNNPTIRLDLLSEDGTTIVDSTEMVPVNSDDVEIVEASIKWDDYNFYVDTQHVLGQNFTVAVDFEAGTDNTVVVFNALRGVRFFLRELYPNFTPVPGHGIEVNDETAIGEQNGRASATFKLEGLVPTAKLPEGHFYQLFAVFRSSGKASNTGKPIYRLNLVEAGDMNGNGTLERSDMTLIRAAMGSSKGDANFRAAADMNNDGVISLDDYRLFFAIYVENRRR